MNAAFARPRLVVSRCLGFEACRWNGQIIASPIVERLRDWLEFHTVCPEVEIGLGVPRLPIRVVRREGVEHLVQSETGDDITLRMQTHARGCLDDLPPVDGFILKGRSPSCGIKDVKIYPGIGKVGPLEGRTSGFFAREVLARWPLLPAEDEGRLTNFLLREHFLMRVHTLAEFRRVRQSGAMRDLVGFHSRHKYLFMACDQQTLKQAGPVVANHDGLPANEVITRYEPLLRRMLAHPPDPGRNVNVLLHLLGYFKERISSSEKAFFLSELERYREGGLPLSAVTAVLRGWVVRFELDYLRNQSYFAPFPPPLADLGDSGRGRDLR